MAQSWLPVPKVFRDRYLGREQATGLWELELSAPLYFYFIVTNFCSSYSFLTVSERRTKGMPRTPR